MSSCGSVDGGSAASQLNHHTLPDEPEEVVDPH